ncbi:MAG: HAMP domain-containing protein [Paracoccaceae bacterium]|nr:MAG: HAMP domain-containing protein [Paracoccaceae bacterium]
MALSMKNLLPRSLYGRAALILIVPVVAIQLVVSLAFIQRHFEGVTRQMTTGVVQEVALLVAQVEAAPDLAAAQVEAARAAALLGLAVSLPAAEVPAAMQPPFWDVSGGEVLAGMREGLPGILGITLRESPREVRLAVATNKGPLAVTVPRRRVSASNPHQLLVLMIATSVLMTLVAYYFLRAQLRPITRLAAAADAFGKGQHLPYRPRGATEVRAAGVAFLDMRGRIERQIEQRTLMLSGVSHDLRTPLTRLRLGLAMLPDDEETRALQADVAQMQRLVDEFLAFARGDAMEEPEETDPADLVRRVVENAERGGQAVRLAGVEGGGRVRLRVQAMQRALENLIGNAVRYGTRAEVSVIFGERSLRLVVEDDGPGIPADRREAAMTPFMRLDDARDPNRGGGVGLGLAIAADVARSHGGALRLGESAALGGLRAEIVLAR